MNWKEGGPGLLDIKILVDAGLANEKPLKVNNTDISPRQFFLKVLKEQNLVGLPQDVIPDDWEITRIFATGKKEGKRISYTMDSIFRSNKNWRCTAGQVAVGVPASIAAQMLAKKGINAKGVIPPELCIKPEPFIKELAKRNIKVYETLKKTM